MFCTCCLLGTYLNVIVRSFFPPSSNVILHSFILFFPSQKCFRHIFPNALRKSPQKPCSICSLIWCDRTAFWHMAPKRSSFQTPFRVWLCSSWPYQLSNLHRNNCLAVADGELEQREPVVQHVFECSECHAFGKRVLKVFFWQHFIIAFSIFMISLYNFATFLSSLHKPAKKLIFIPCINHPESSRWLFSAMTFKPTNSAFVPFLIAFVSSKYSYAVLANINQIRWTTISKNKKLLKMRISSQKKITRSPHFFGNESFCTKQTEKQAGKQIDAPLWIWHYVQKSAPTTNYVASSDQKRDCRNTKILF